MDHIIQKDEPPALSAKIFLAICLPIPGTTKRSFSFKVLTGTLVMVVFDQVGTLQIRYQTT